MEKQKDGQEAISAMSSNSNLRYLKSVRTRFRNTLKEEVEKAASLLTSESEEYELDEKISSASSCMEKISLYREKVENQSEKLVTSMGESEEIEVIVDDDCSLCFRAMDIYLELKNFLSKLYKLKDKLEEKTHEESDTHLLIQLQQNMQQLMSSQMKQQEFTNRKEAEKLSAVKLPKIDMISFAGDKTKWTEFWDCFQSAVHNNKMISNIEKFTYLKSKLFGEAGRAIAGLALSSENYNVAMDILKKRFGNSQEIIDLHYKRLINIPSATNKVSSLRYLIDNVDKHFRSLESLDQNVNQDIIVSIIKSKIPEDVLLQLEIMKDVDEKWTVRTISKRLNDYIVARERAVKDTNSTDIRQRRSATMSYERKERSFGPGMRNRTSESTPKHTTEAFVAGENRAITQAFTKACRYCNGEHWSDECKRYKTIDERKKRLKGCCYKCLKDNHRAKDCKSTRVCTYCKKVNVHHRSLCDKRFQINQNHESANLSNEVENVENTESENKTLENEETGLLSYNENVLMQTAFTEIKNARNGQSEHVRLMLDCGSHRTYVSQSLADRLNLEVNGEQSIHLITFGSRNEKVIQTKSTKIDIKLQNGEYMTLTANIVPNITGTISRKAVRLKSQSKFDSLTKDLILADNIPTHNETETLDLLIGNDYYLDIVQTEKIEVQQGLYLLATKFGWMLSGRTEVTDEYDSSDMNMLILNYGNNVTKTNVFTRRTV
ncbi:uncharacterized protein LOC128551737 [Mercenaria mercenaria]|uniref:uncharacterized protein LOC128551737 n=1 Tax=Mercenaria mercenaria TaxID=6596 RepID=UPI00234E81A4|nr:uncharacterized protein LOC128551737 [Mercenaria mercenaria]